MENGTLETHFYPDGESIGFSYDRGHSHANVWFSSPTGLWCWEAHNGDLKAEGEHPDKEAAAYAAKSVADAFWDVPYCE